MTQQLPEGWVTSVLRDVTERVVNAHPEDEPDRDFGYIDISAIDNQRFTVLKERVKRFKGRDAPSRARRPVQFGDVLFSNVRTYLKNVALITDHMTADLCSTGFTVLRPTGALDSRYLLRWVLRREFVDSITETQTGTHYPATSDSAILAQDILLPPLGEQRRIVETVEPMLELVTGTRERLARVLGIVRRLRQAAHAAIFSGKLTEDWRRSNPRDRPLVEEEVLEESEVAPLLPDFPEEWVVTTVGRIAERLQYGTSQKASRSGSGVPILRMANIQEGRLDLTDLKYVPKAYGQEAFLVRKGDILFNRTNSPELVGKAAVAHPGSGMLFASYLIRVRVESEVALPEYVCAWINSPWGREWARMVRTDGVSQSNINSSKLAAMPLPLPSLREQQEAVLRLGALLDAADAIEQRLASVTHRVEAVADAILARAFSGHLVPTEAQLASVQGRPYEPASTLLERVGRTHGRRVSHTAHRQLRHRARKPTPPKR